MAAKGGGNGGGRGATGAKAPINVLLLAVVILGGCYIISEQLLATMGAPGSLEHAGGSAPDADAAAAGAQVILSTAPSREVGEKLARALLDKKLAACVNMIDNVSSFYTWKGEITSDAELLLVIKARRSAFDAIDAVLRELHPYDTYELLALPVSRGTQKYLDWIGEVTTAI